MAPREVKNCHNKSAAKIISFQHHAHPLTYRGIQVRRNSEQPHPTAFNPLTMGLLALAGTSLVALEHVYIMTLEMFLWTTPRGQKAFNLTPAFAAQTKTMAANQGLYNGFLAAGLLWGLVHPDALVGKQCCLASKNTLWFRKQCSAGD